MMRKTIILLSCVCAFLMTHAQNETSYHLDPTQIIGEISPEIYSQFLEHICNSIHGGLWGDIVLNGTLEMADGYGGWHTRGNYLLQKKKGNFDRISFGSEEWKNYEVELEARNITGNECIVVSVRNSGNQFYDINLFGYGQTRYLLEKNTGGRYNAFLVEKDGKADKKQWNRIKIRCENEKISAWLNGQLVFTHADTAAPILKGKIGLNTYGTQCEVRNIRVKDLKGKILFKGVPTEKELYTAVPTYWQQTGEAIVRADDTDPFNSDYSQIIKTDNQSGGLIQKGVYISSQDRYKGYFYYKPLQANSQLTLSILSPEGETIATVTPEMSVKGWQRCDFEFSSDIETSDASLVFQVAPSGEVAVDQLSIMPLSALRNGGFRADMLKALIDIHPATIRYPGGCYASQYNWKDGIGPHEKRRIHPYEIWEDRDVNQFGTDEFLTLCEKTEAEPIFVLNINKGIENALEWIEYIQTQREKALRYIEIDNETWHMGPEAYADSVIVYSKAIRALYPQIKIIACGPYAYDTGLGQADHLHWTQRLLDKAATYIDFISPHYYNGLLNDLDYQTDPRQYESFIREMGQLISKSANPNIKIYMSEWNPMTTDWRTGLYAGSILNAFERQSHLVKISCPALLFRRTWANMWDNALINHDNHTLFLAPNYLVMKLWNDHYAPYLLALEGGNEAINAVATRSKTGRHLYLKLVNTSSENTEIKLNIASIVTVQNASFSVIIPAEERDSNTIASPEKIGVEKGEITYSGNEIHTRLPGYAVGVIQITIQP